MLSSTDSSSSATKRFRVLGSSYLQSPTYSLHNIDPFMVHFDSAYPAYTVVSVEDVLPFVPMEVSLPGKELGE